MTRKGSTCKSILSPILSQVEKVDSDLRAITEASNRPAELLSACIDDAALIKRYFSQLSKQIDGFIGHLEEQAEDEGPIPQELPESDGCYAGKTKFGLAHLRDQTVATIHQIIRQSPQFEKLGFCKIEVGDDVVRDIKLQKINGLEIDKLDGLQSKTVLLSPRKKDDPLYGLACSSLIGDNNEAGSFRIPHLSRRHRGPEPRDLFISAVRDARTDGGQPYLVIPTESCSSLLKSIGLDPELLDCGEQLKKTASRIAGVHAAYLYISASRGSSSPLHVEDGFLGSINILLAGAPKVWLMVEPCYRNKLEDKARKYLGGNSQRRRRDQKQECSQFVRHLSTLLSPQLLDSWEIPYRIVSCKAGEMIVTFSETYHQVVNAGPNLALAINFAESEWAGPPENYVFCTKEQCGTLSITLSDLQVQRSTCGSEDGPGDESVSESQATGGSPNSRKNRRLSLELEEVNDATDEFLEGTPSLDEQFPKTRTPPRPPSTAGEPDESSSTALLSSNASLSSRIPQNLSPNVQTPLEQPETPGAPDDRSINAQSPSGTPKTPGSPDDHSANSQAPSRFPRGLNARYGRSSSTRTLSAAPETPKSSSSKSCKTQTPPTVLTELEVGSKEKAKLENAHDAAITDPIIIPADDEDEMPDTIELVVDEPCTIKSAVETVEMKLNRLVQELLPFAKGLGVSGETFERFRLNNKLNDDAITMTLKQILPESVEILIASHAIKNPPGSGTPLRNAAAKSLVPPATLVHGPRSSHLCIACNVKSRSLEFVWKGSGDHWILAVVDFPSKKVHIYGNEGGHDEKAKAIACDISEFVNNHRMAQGLPAVGWSDPVTHPLYPTSSFPDCYNCGIAVISRAHAFIYPDKALETPYDASDADLSKQLNDLRVAYLESILRRCQRVKDDEIERGFLTPVSKSKKRPSPFPDASPTKIVVQGAHLRRRVTSPPPPIILVPRPEAQRWEDCLFRAAEQGGFRGHCILEALRSASTSLPTLKKIRILQYICEFASTEVLLRIKGILNEPKALENRVNHADQDLVNLHLQIRKYEKVSFLAQFTKFKCQLFYFEKFEEQKNSKQVEMAAEKKKHNAQRISNQRKGLQKPVRGEGSGKNGQSADALVRKEYADRIVSQTGLDEVTIRNELNQNLKEGKTLHYLLSPRCGRGDRCKLRSLLLLPLYGTGNRSPALDLIAQNPPEQAKDLSRSVSRREILDLNEESTRFLRAVLLTARPELEEIESYLPGAELTYPRLLQTIVDDPNSSTPPNSTYLALASDERIRETKPKDIARLFKPDFLGKLQLEFREGKN